MRYLLVICMALLPLSASVYYAKVEPVQKYTIKANASGKVLSVYEDAEGKVSNGGLLIQIDDFLNKSELNSSLTKLQALKETLRLTNKSLVNAIQVEKVKESSYNRIKDLKTKSQIEKEAELINLINAQNQVITLENSIQNLLVSISDLEYKITTLKDTIENKNVKITKGYLIYSLNVKEGDYVNVGTSLVDAYNVSKGKLTIYLSKEDIALAKSGVIYLNDAASKYKVEKIWDVADTQNISAYKAEILIDAPQRFSDLIKIEFKEQ